jgi:hypothetical protein
MDPFTPAARFLSYVLHPLLMPFYAVLLLFNINTYLSFSVSPQLQQIILLVVFVTTLAFPLLTSYLLLQKGSINSLEMETKEERRTPFLLAGLCYLACYMLLYKLPVARVLSVMVIAAAATIFLAWLLSFRYKISIHMIGIGGLTGVLFAIARLFSADLTLLIILCFVVSGVLGTARLILGAHTPSQIYSGFLAGFLTEWVVVTGWATF